MTEAQQAEYDALVMQVASLCMRAEYVTTPALLAKFAEDVQKVARG